jgi:membrane protease YdiL (CAAX protease family)
MNAPLHTRTRPLPRRWSRDEELLRAVLALVAVWSLLLVAGLAGSCMAPSASMLAAFIAATAFLLATRSSRRDRRAAASVALLLMGLLCGFASYPAWVALIAAVGFGLGLGPVAALLPGSGGATLWVATVLLGPVFEEALYRERLWCALRPAIGSGGAVVATTVLFAIPHLEPWRVLATSLVGLALGGAMWVSGSLALCIGLHMGLNLAAWACGVPPVRLALAPGSAAVAGIAGLAAAIVLSRLTEWRPLLAGGTKAPGAVTA